MVERLTVGNLARINSTRRLKTQLAGRLFQYTKVYQQSTQPYLLCSLHHGYSPLNKKPVQGENPITSFGIRVMFSVFREETFISRLKILKMQISPGLSRALLQKHEKTRYTWPGCNWKSSWYHTPANAALMILFKIWRVRSISYDMLRIPKLGKVIGPLELGTGSHSRWSGPDHHLQASFSYHQYLRSSFVHSLCKLWTFCCVAAL